MEAVRQIMAKVALESCGWIIPADSTIILPFAEDANTLLRVLKHGLGDETKH